MGGYGGEGDIQAGDVVYGYLEGVNVYVADSAGLNFWDFEAYIHLQKQNRFKPVPLKETFRRGL